ncbi:MAG: GatB/YqeY domain-containing protein [Solirubrobacteraceae bacterium]
MSVSERIRSDVADAMRAGDRARAGALRLVLSELQKDAKEGSGNELAVLRRERKRRLDAAAQYRDAGRAELAAGEEREAELIAGYLPAELGDAELAALVDAAIAETGADSARDMGKVMGVLMPRVEGRAEGGRVSGLVRERLA